MIAFRLSQGAVVLGIVGMFLLSACEKEAVVEPEQDAIVIGSIHGVVKNATAGERLSGVTVTWAGGVTALSVQSTTTDDKGYYIINGLNPGEYTISFTGLEGFTEFTVTAGIPSVLAVVALMEEDAKGVYYISENLNASLYELNGGFKGVIWAPLEDGTSKAASGATVQFDVSITSVAPSLYNTTSSEDGSFSLTGLPAGAFGNLYVLPYSDGDVSYATKSVTSATLSSGEVKDVGDITLTLATGTPFLVISNFEGKEDVKVDASLTGTFSKAIDSASFEVDISGYNPGPEGLAVSWTDDVTFTITPSNPFTVDTYYSITLQGVSVDGNSFAIYTSFNTEEDIYLVSTNLWADEDRTAVDNFPVDSAITLTFSREVDLYSVDTEIKLYDDSNGLVNGDETLSDDKLVLTFTPSANLETGSNYAISGSVASLLLDDVAYVYGTFATAPALVDLPAQVTGAEHDTTYISGDWPVDYNSRDFKFKWTGVVGAEGYNIYAKDTLNNRNYVHLETLPVGDDQAPEATYSDIVYLPASFDYFEDDGIVTPFTHGTQVTFTIRAYNGAGEGPASAEITLSDKQSPTHTLGSQSGTTNNSGGVIPLEVTVSLSSGEYLSRASTTVTVTGYQVPAVMEWNDTNTGGVISITIPADSTKVGESLIINMYDTSGNMAADTLPLW